MADLTTALEKTVQGNLQEIKLATEFLTSIEKKPEFLAQLIQIIASDQVALHSRQAATVYFKNFLQKYWPLGELQEWTIPENAQVEIKKHIVNLMISTPVLLQKQIADALEIISTSEFPEKWPEVLPELIQSTKTALGENNIPRATQLLKAINAILHRYRSADNIEQVNKELLFILSHIIVPLQEQFTYCSTTLQNSGNDTKKQVIVLEMALQLFKIFYCLNCVELPEVVEDKLQFWMGEHMKYLSFQSESEDLLSEENDEEPGVLLKVYSSIFDNITIYIQKYEEEFKPFLQDFVRAVWGRITSAKTDPKFDHMVSKGIRVLTCISTGVAHKIFDTEGVLKQTCEMIVIPNIVFREADKLHFKEEPTEYIRSDLEDSESFTRRSGARDLVKGLRKHFESQVTQILALYIFDLLNQYQADRAKNWKQKDAALFLIAALTVTGEIQGRGVTVVNAGVPIVKFFEDHVLPEFDLIPGNQPVIQADILRFSITFRNQIPVQHYPKIIESAIKMLTSKYYVVNTYAAACIETLLTVRDGSTPRFGENQIRGYLEGIFTNSFALLDKEKSKDNEYVMKVIMRVLSVAQTDIGPNVVSMIMNKLTPVLERVCKNPKFPAFNHYLFESFACLILCLRRNDPSSVKVLYSSILPIFRAILNEDFANFSPYLFQLLAMFLEITPGKLTETDVVVLESYGVVPKYWEETGNIPALVRLTKAFLRKDFATILERKKFEPILGVFQRLLASPIQDHHSFELLKVILETAPKEAFESVIKPILQLCFNRLSPKKSFKVMRGFILFLCRLTLKYSFEFVLVACNSVQQGIFVKVEDLWAEVLSHSFRPEDRKVLAIATTRMLCDPLILGPEYREKVPDLVTGLANSFIGEKKIVTTVSENDDTFEDLSNRQKGIHTSFLRLVHSSTGPEPDETQAILGNASLDQYVVTLLRQYIAANPAIKAVIPADASNEFIKTILQ